MGGKSNSTKNLTALAPRNEVGTKDSCIQAAKNCTEIHNNSRNVALRATVVQGGSVFLSLPRASKFFTLSSKKQRGKANLHFL